MAIAQSIAPHLPYLRRFARALNGTQAGGDAYVAATLEALVADPSAFPVDIPPRLGLYKIFLKLWSSVDDGGHQINGALDPVGRNLDALTPSTRQAFLLVAVEGFSVDEVAKILGRTPEETSQLIDAAGREIAEQVATSVLIIEDEPIIALDIEGMVRDLGHDVTGVARTHRARSVPRQVRTPGLRARRHPARRRKFGA